MDRGRALVLAATAASVVVELIAIVTAFPRFGFSHLPRQLVRLALEVWLCVKLYQRRNWARLVVGNLCGVGTCAAVSFIAIFHSRLSVAAISVLLIIAVVQLGVSSALLVSTSVRQYFRASD